MKQFVVSAFTYEDGGYSYEMEEFSTYAAAEEFANKKRKEGFYGVLAHSRCDECYRFSHDLECICN
jgi:hypothetical protein